MRERERGRERGRGRQREGGREREGELGGGCSDLHVYKYMYKLTATSCMNMTYEHSGTIKTYRKWKEGY